MKTNLSSLTILTLLFITSILTAQNNALHFDGVDDYVEIPDDPSIDFTVNQNFTIEVWVKPDMVQPYMFNPDNDIIEKWSTSADPYPYVIRYLRADGRVFARRYDGANNPGPNSTSSINDGGWHHIAFVKSGADLRLYIDGVLEDEVNDNTANPTENNYPLSLGRRGSDENYWAGEMDELRIWNVARSTAEINANMNREISASSPGLVSYYPFNEGLANGDNTGVTTLPDAADGNDGTLNNFSLMGNTSNWVGSGVALVGIPTMGQWGIIICSLLLLIIGIFFIKSRSFNSVLKN